MKRNLEIAKNPDLLRILVNERKTLKNSPIILHDKQTNANFYQGTAQVTIEKQKLPIQLLSDKHKYNRIKYSLQLQCKALTEKPYFRLDTDGPAHRNPSGPLKGQQIQTPHFNTFNELGFAIAFHTKELRSHDICDQLKKDINQGVILFCKKANVRLNKSEFPTVELKKREVPFVDFNSDPNQAINFKIN